MIDQGTDWCDCGAPWILALVFTFCDLLWIIGAGWNRRYVLTCTGCGTAETVTREEVETQIGNRMPLRYRYGWAIYLGVSLVILAAAHR